MLLRLQRLSVEEIPLDRDQRATDLLRTTWLGVGPCCGANIKREREQRLTYVSPFSASEVWWPLCCKLQSQPRKRATISEHVIAPLSEFTPLSKLRHSNYPVRASMPSSAAGNLPACSHTLVTPLLFAAALPSSTVMTYHQPESLFQTQKVFPRNTRRLPMSPTTSQTPASTVVVWARGEPADRSCSKKIHRISEVLASSKTKKEHQ